MNFTFTDEQLAYRDSVRTFLQTEITPDWIRRRWQAGRELDSMLWQQMSDLGLTTLLIPEAHGGLGLNEVDMILLVEECGKVALPGEVIHTAMVAAPLLAELANDYHNCAELLTQIATGEQRVMIQHPLNPYMNDADLVDWFILVNDGSLYLVSKDQLSMTAYKSLDPSRRLFKLDWQPDPKALICTGDRVHTLLQATANRGALATAAQLIGLAQAMVDQSVEYCHQRKQFGKPIGSFQAIKHLLADCAVKIEFARSPLYRAAYTTSKVPNRAGIAVAHAKIATGEAALLAAKQAIQVHGAIGYTWECDLHIWMKSAWVLEKTWGDQGFHKKLIHDWLMNDKSHIGAGNTFGRLELGELDTQDLMR